MSSQFVRRVVATCALAAALVGQPLLASPARADDGAPPARGKRSDEPRKSRKQELEERRKAQEEAKKYAIEPRVAEVFAEVREHLGAERYADAERSLRKLRRQKLTPYEEAQTQRLHGYVAYGRQDNAAAIQYLSKALAENALRPSDQADVLFQVAQIQAVEKRWRDVIATLDAWFQAVEKPNSVGYYLKALAHYQIQDLDGALLPATQAVEIAQTPQQAWLQLLLAIQLTRKDYAAATPVLVKLISFYPNSGKGYWLQLSALYGVREDMQRALAVMEVAYRKGILTEDQDLIRLAQLNLLLGIPQRAANVLEKELAAQRIQEDAEAFELLSGSWILAREVEKAEAPLARAAELAPKGDLYVRLAQVHMMQEEWSDAAGALRKALAKGGLHESANAELLLGISYFNERELQEARAWFTRAHQSVAMREQAETWLEHVDREIDTRGAQTGTPG